MQPARSDDLIGKQSPQLVEADVLVPRIHALLRDVLAEWMAKVPVIMQQGRGDDDRWLTRLPGEGRALQRMLKLRHILAVMAMAVLAVGGEDIVE
jgi:hypothetical protein